MGANQSNSAVPPPPASHEPHGQGPGGLAVAAFVLGMMSFCLGPLTALPSIVFGIMAVSGRRTAQSSSPGLAIAGLALSCVGMVLFIAVWGILAAILLPALARAREAARRASCQNNLKQAGIVFTMFAHENRGEYYPELSQEPGRLMFSADPVYPEYLLDLDVLLCPSDFDAANSDAITSNAKTGVDDHSYYYLGFAVTNDQELAAFAEAYRAQIANGLPFTRDLTVPMGTGNAEGDTIYRLRIGVERMAGPADSTAASSVLDASQIPVLIERMDNHVPIGGNVLYLDGSVEFLRLGTWPMTESAQRILSSLDALGP